MHRPLCLVLSLSTLLAGCGSDGSTTTDAGPQNMIDGGSGPSADAGDAAHAAPPVFDVDNTPLPKFLDYDLIELDKLARISRFRSGIGHDYSDQVETCRSMKHYFQPKPSVDWASVAIRAPAAGTVVRMDEEWAGTQIHLQTASQPAFTIVIFHVHPAAGLAIGTKLAGGQAIGTHVGSQTMSDVAVQVISASGLRLVSYFELVTDAVFAGYQARGVISRSAVQISKAERDASPLVCMGEQFASEGTIENWVVLN